VRRLAALVVLLCLSAPAALAEPPPRRLFVIGDSLAYDNRAPLRHELKRWTIESDFSFARLAAETARDLRGRAHARPPLAPVIHVSSGTGDDPGDPEGFRAQVRRVLRIAGKRRCVVRANIWRLRLEEPTFEVLNDVLAKADRRYVNLRVVDWHALVEAHTGWLVDPVHVNAAGNRARAKAVALAVRACRRQLSRQP
jgi:hypothetical protein